MCCLEIYTKKHPMPFLSKIGSHRAHAAVPRAPRGEVGALAFSHALARSNLETPGCRPPKQEWSRPAVTTGGPHSGMQRRAPASSLLVLSRIHSLIHSRTHSSLTHTLFHLLTLSFAHSFITHSLSLAHSFITHSFTCSLIHSLITHSFTHSLITHSLFIHSLSLAHSLIYSLITDPPTHSLLIHACIHSLTHY